MLLDPHPPAFWHACSGAAHPMTMSWTLLARASTRNFGAPVVTSREPFDTAEGRTRPSQLFCASSDPKKAERRGEAVSELFNEQMLKLLDGRNFASVATLNRDGGPQTSVVWIVREVDTVLFSTTAGRQKARNLARDPRVSLTVFDTANPYQSVDIRGTVELIDDSEKSLPRRLSQKYLARTRRPSRMRCSG
ncbi:PPOX class F420-dependent oxidoreductase [Streptomyces sp. NPDC048252]|uniref:PPOX class F420-dependent oxidoreductase n=1 Tax=Streptomyces sp. NPDC048252 TaxID=3154612 RepID=UPI00341E5B49